MVTEKLIIHMVYDITDKKQQMSYYFHFKYFFLYEMFQKRGKNKKERKKKADHIS